MAGFLLRFAKILPMMLVFGIVGPAFLGFYFLLDEPGIEWMFWWGVVITAADVALAAVVAWAGESGRMLKMRKHVDRQVMIQAQVKSAPDVSPPEETPAARLAELDELMRKDLLTTEEYEASRKRILGEL